MWEREVITYRLKDTHMKTEKMVQWLRVLPVLIKDLGSVTNTDMVADNRLQFQKTQCPFLI